MSQPRALMHEDQADPPIYPSVWAALTPILGLTLWTLLFWGPLQIEWSDPEAAWSNVFLYLSPLLPLAIGCVTRTPWLLLLGFLGLFLPGYLTMAEPDQALLETFEGFSSLAVVLVLYLLVATLWSHTRPPTRASTAMPEPATLGEDKAAPLRDGRNIMAMPEPRPELRRDLWWPYAMHFTPRLVVLVLLWLVPMVALNFSDNAALRFLDGFGAQAAQAQVMANLLTFFVWLVVAYLFFISPGLNLELEQRALDRNLAQRSAKLSKSRSTWLIALLVIVASAAGIAMVMLVLP